MSAQHLTRQRGPFSNQRGFTLIELMIVIVIVSILVAIAVPSYTAQVQKSRRTEARTAILDLAGREERYFSTSNAYSQNDGPLGYAAATSNVRIFNLSIGSGYYTVTVTVPDITQVPTPANSYLITATAAGTTQVNDAACTSFFINQIGQQGYGGSAPTAATCWGN